MRDLHVTKHMTVDLMRCLDYAWRIFIASPDEKKNTSQTPRLLHGPVATLPYKGSLTPMLKLPKIASKWHTFNSSQDRRYIGEWMVTLLCGSAPAS